MLALGKSLWWPGPAGIEILDTIRPTILSAMGILRQLRAGLKFASGRQHGQLRDSAGQRCKLSEGCDNGHPTGAVQ